MIVMQEEDLLTSSSSLSSVVGRALVRGGGLGGGKEMGRGLQSKTHMHANGALGVHPHHQGTA